MEPVTLTYRSLDGLTDAVLTSPRFAARLLSDGRPAIDARFDGDRITFTAATGDFMLRSRVAVIFEDVLGDEWRRHVAPEAAGC
jgi:hypothetical protein